MKCAFCTQKDILERAIVRERLTWAFIGNMPITPGHTLVCPTRCVANMGELSQEEREALWQLVERIKLALRATFSAEGFNVAVNEGIVAGQSVPHVHVHVVPRKEGDVGVYEYEPRQFLYRPGLRPESPEQELKEVAAKIKAYVAP